MTFLSDNIGSIIVGIIVAAIIGIAIKSLIKDKKEGKCSCGSCSDCGHACYSFQNSDINRNKADYLYKLNLKVMGMTCAHCASKVERALNSLDGVWATVNLKKNSVHILLKNKPDREKLIKAIADAGYEAK